MDNLYTIGHSQHKLQFFVELLRQYGITYVLDVRSTPYSKYAEQFNRNIIEKTFPDYGINYSFMGNHFGARPDDKELYSSEGYLDFKKVADNDKFNRGIDNVISGLHRGHRIALMCTEKDPIDCHRAILVSRAFESREIIANHILSNGKLQTQIELNNRLLERYFPDRNQLTLFNYENEFDSMEYLEAAYRKRNKEVGYYKEGTMAAII